MLMLVFTVDAPPFLRMFTERLSDSIVINAKSQGKEQLQEAATDLKNKVSSWWKS